MALLCVCEGMFGRVLQNCLSVCELGRAKLYPMASGCFGWLLGHP